MTTDAVEILHYYATVDSIELSSRRGFRETENEIVTMMKGETVNKKQTFEIESEWKSITRLEQFNTFSGEWLAIDITTFEHSIVERYINEKNIIFNKYTHIGPKIGERILKWS